MGQKIKGKPYIRFNTSFERLTFSPPSNSVVFAADLKDTVSGLRLFDTRFHFTGEPLLSGHIEEETSGHLLKVGRFILSH